MKRLALALVALGPLAGVIIAGPPLVGRGLLASGHAGLAAMFLHDPAWTGYALAKAGRYDAAVAAFGSSPASAYNRANALAEAHRYRDAIEAYNDALDADPEDADAQFNKAIVEKIVAGGALDAGKGGGLANAEANKDFHGKRSDIGDGETSSSGNGYVGSEEGASSRGAQGSSKVSRVGTGTQNSKNAGEGKATGSASEGAGPGRSGGDLADVTAMLAANQRRGLRGHTDQGIIPSVEWLETLPDDPGRFLKLRILAERQRRTAHTAAPEDDD